MEKIVAGSRWGFDLAGILNRPLGCLHSGRLRSHRARDWTMLDERMKDLGEHTGSLCPQEAVAQGAEA